MASYIVVYKTVSHVSLPRMRELARATTLVALNGRMLLS
jgi:hypothetical protein